MLIEYSSNNSGGSWWLTDDDWHNLEAAGWAVTWFKDDEFCRDINTDGPGRFLGALAKYATKEFDSVEDAKADWETITNRYADEEGCSCCGVPHNFYED